MTLIELMVALVLIALLSGIAALGIRAATRPQQMALSTRIDSLRREALRTGRMQQAYVADSVRSGALLVLPTGEVIADSMLRLQPLTGDVQP